MSNTIPCPGCKKEIPLDKDGLPTTKVSVRQRSDKSHQIFCSSLCEATDWTKRKIDLQRMTRGMPLWHSPDCRPPMARAGVSK